MTADQHRDDLSERAVDDLLLGVGDLGVETLRIADGEFQVVLLREMDELVGFPEFERDRLLQHHVLAALQAVSRDRIVVRLRRGRDEHHRNVVVVDDVVVVECRARRLVERLHLGEPIRLDVAEVQLVDQRGARQSFRRAAPRSSRLRCTQPRPASPDASPACLRPKFARRAAAGKPLTSILHSPPIWSHSRQADSDPFRGGRVETRTIRLREGALARRRDPPHGRAQGRGEAAGGRAEPDRDAEHAAVRAPPC